MLGSCRRGAQAGSNEYRCNASPRIITSKDERLRSVQHVCLALPRMARALHKQARQLGFLIYNL